MWRIYSFSTLKKLHLDDSELGLAELGSHLKRRFTDIYSLSPHRFEELVADTFCQLGYLCRLTPCSRDGGYDIVLLQNSTGAQILVQCKRYAKQKKVHVGHVRELLGVQLFEGAQRAIFVTTSSFTEPAVRMAKLLEARQNSFSMQLVDADSLVKALEVYNELLPPIHLLDPRRMASS